MLFKCIMIFTAALPILVLESLTYFGDCLIQLAMLPFDNKSMQAGFFPIFINGICNQNTSGLKA